MLQVMQEYCFRLTIWNVNSGYDYLSTREIDSFRLTIWNVNMQKINRYKENYFHFRLTIWNVNKPPSAFF